MDQRNDHVVVTDIRMPFMSMVVFMVKWAIASIPAMIILVLLGAVFLGFLGGIGNKGLNDRRSSVTAPSRIAPANVLYQGYLAAMASDSQAAADDYAAKIRENYPDSPERLLLDNAQ